MLLMAPYVRYTLPRRYFSADFHIADALLPRATLILAPRHAIDML